MISADILADSISKEHHSRITTFKIVMPKQLLAQFNTHRIISRVAASSRAIPSAKVLEQVEYEPYLPKTWQYRQSGMQPAGPMSEEDCLQMKDLEGELREKALWIVARMASLRASKEDINRYLEPWMYAAVVATATEWENYFALRDHPHAQGAHREVAHLMHEAYKQSVPVERSLFGEGRTRWHLPFITQEERENVPLTWLPLVSAARCGRVSYNRAGETRTIEEDVQRALSFVEDKHWSPLDQVGYPSLHPNFSGALLGWTPLRKMYAGESGTKRYGTQYDAHPWAVRSIDPGEVKHEPDV